MEVKAASPWLGVDLFGVNNLIRENNHHRIILLCRLPIVYSGGLVMSKSIAPLTLQDMEGALHGLLVLGICDFLLRHLVCEASAGHTREPIQAR